MKYLTLLLVLISQFSFAQNHLEPANSFFDVYDSQYENYKKLRETLFEGISDQPKIRMIIFPSFSKEYVFQIEEDSKIKGKYSIIINEPIEGSIFGNPNLKITVKTYQSTISENDLDILYELLYSAIIKTQFRTDNMIGGDGITYFLSIWETGLKSAEIWSPNDPNLKELIFIMETVVDKAKSEKEISFSKKFKNSILELTKKFNKKPTLKEIEFLLNFNKCILEIESQYPELIKLNDSFSFELNEIYEEVYLLVNESGISFSQIDEIIFEHKQYYDSDFFFDNNDELSVEYKEKLIKENSPFLKLIQTYKSDL